MQNAEAFISTGASAHWDMLVFKHNRHQVDSARQLAKEMGFTWFRSKITDRWDIYPISQKLEPASLYENKNYLEAIPQCEKDRDASLFIDYTGQTWPCCHMAEAYLSEVGKQLHNDIRLYTASELLDEYKVKLNTQPFYICRRACGESSGKRSQWKTEEQLR